MRSLAWPTFGAAAIAYVAGTALLATAPMEALGGPAVFWPAVATTLSFLFYALVGAVIVTRGGANRVGWIFLAMGSIYQIRTLVHGFLNHAVLVQPTLIPGAEAVGWLANVWVVSFGLVPLLFLLFPTGRLPSRRWRVVVWALLPATLIGLARSSVKVGGRRFEIGLDDQLLNAAGPVAADAYELVGDWLYLALFAPSVIALVARLRRSRGVEHQQLKWFAYACVLLVAAGVVLTVLFIAIGPDASGAPYPLALFLGIPAALALAALPAAVAFAILRYRLYDIDRFISRTISYGLITALLVAVFLLVNLGLQSVLSLVTSGNSLAVAGSTLLAAALFTPVRRRVQRIIDRRFDRARYDGERTASAFSVRMRDATDLPTVAQDLDITVRRAIAPSSVGLWLRGSGR